MYSLLALIKLVLLALVVVLGVIAGLLSPLMPSGWYPRLALAWHGSIVRIVGASMQFSGAAFQPGALLVGNHVSWLDIPVLGSRFPAVFLANSQIRRWPILGWVVKRAGTLFIDRGRGAARALEEMRDTLHAGRSVLIFPEGRTSGGGEVLRFQPRLFQSAIDSGADIQAVAVRYRDRDGRHPARIRYDGDINFLVSVWNTLRGPGFRAEIHVFAPVPGDSSRDALSRQVHEGVSEWVRSS